MPLKVSGLRKSYDPPENLRSQAHGPFEIITLPILNQTINNKNTHDKDDRLKALEVKRHRVRSMHDPAKDDERGSNKEGNLNAAANRDVDPQIHLALVSDAYSCNTLLAIAENGQEDKPNEGFANVGGFEKRVDAANQEVCANGNGY